MGLLEPDDFVDEWRAVVPLSSGRDAELWIVTSEPEAPPRVLALARPRVASDERARARFEWLASEPALAAAGPAVVARGIFEELPYRVTEYVHGVNLEQLLAALAHDGSRLVPELAVTIARGAARALGALHAQGVAHGALRSRHVLVSVKGEVRIVGAEGPYARADRSRYRAPELGGDVTASGPGDVYALGVLSWELLTMRRAVFEGDALAPARRFSEDVPGALERAVGAATALDVEARPPDGEALAASLAAALAPRSEEDLARLVVETVAARLEEIEASLAPRSSAVPTVAGGGQARDPGSLTRPTAAVDFVAALPTPGASRRTATRSASPDQAPRPPPAPTTDVRGRALALLAAVALTLAALSFLAARYILAP